MSKESTFNPFSWKAVGRKTLVTAILTALAFSFSACEKDKTDVAPTTTSDPTLDRILALGFDQKNIKDEGTYYLVEGDIRFDKKNTTTPIIQPGVTAQSQDQAHSWNLIYYDKQPNITYRIDSRLSSAAAIIQDAVNEWNSIQGCRVKLSLATGSSADITFTPQNLRSGVLGQGDFPNGNGSPGTYVYVDPNQIAFASAGTFKLVVVHELGHTFGFRHTNWATRGETETSSDYPNANGNVVINGTPWTDSNSVMNSGDQPNQAMGWVGFSSYDIIGFQNLYPVYAASIGTGYYKILNRATGKSIDISGGGSNRNDGVQIVQWGDGGSASEQWSIQRTSDDHYKIVNRVTFKSIDVSGGSTNLGTDVPLVQWGNGSAENWRFQDVGDGYYKIVNRYTGKCIDVSGGGNYNYDGRPLVQYYYQGHASQQWRLAL